MRLQQFSSRSLRRSLALVASEGLLTWVIWAAALGMIFSVFLAWDGYRSSEGQADATASRLAAAVERGVARNLELMDSSLRAAAGGYLQIDRAARDPFVSFFQALNEKGDVVAASPAAQYGENWSNRDYFVALKKGYANEPYIGRPFATVTDEGAAISISRRITDPDGRFAGVVVIGMRLAYFRDLLNRLELGPHGSATLLHYDGTIFMRLPFDRNDIGRTVDASAPFHAFMRDGFTPAVAVDPIDHVQRHFAFRRVGTFPLVVSIGLANDASHPAWLAGFWLTMLSTAAFCTLSALLAYRLSCERRQRETAERESQEKSRFLTTLSHDLRSPLHGMLGYADQLAHEGGLDPAQSRQVAQIIQAGRHMREVVNVVLDYARIEALGPSLHMRRTDMRTLVEECLAVIEPGARARGLTTRCTVSPDVPAHFVTDGVQLRHILMNLLGNAVKYTLQGTVELRVTGDEDHLTIEVIDTGIGIPEGQRHRLFKEYERFGTERTSIEGTGLGLAIAHRLVRRMGGSMGHRDNLGGGSIFWLELPAGAADEADSAASVEDISPERLNVLVVDDSAINLEVAASFLRNAGHTATECHDGSEAVALVAAQDFDVVLMDVRMAGIDGLETTRRIREMGGPRGQVPIVAVTANALDQHAEECRRAGMSGHLAKPFTHTELLAAVARAAARRPRAPSGTESAIDHDSMAQLAACMGEEAVHRLLDCLALRIEAVLRKLDDPAAFEAPTALAELAHELVGSGGTLGFIRLASVAGRFERGLATNTADAAEMRHELMASLTELRRRRSLETTLSD